ncbi:MAG: radical SAM protein [Thermodesulfobacteriota bacterium]
MIPIADMKLIQIELTNACHLSCANCTRMVGHHARPFMMDLKTVERAIMSLEGYAGHIGLMGGEPALHPRFSEVLELLRRLIPEKERRELWTAGYKWDEYGEIIHETFDVEYIAYNDHSDPEVGWHQPLLIAIDEVVEDKKLMWKLIENCWVQQRWSASMTTKGAFFCEVAAAMDHLFDGPGGWPLEKGWWKRTPEDEDFKEQVRRYCPSCSACLPMPMIPNNHVDRDWISPENAKRLETVRSPKYLEGRFMVVDIENLADYVRGCDGEPGVERGSLKDFPLWTPWNYRSVVYNAPGEGVLSAAQVRMMQTGQKGRVKSLSLKSC